MAILTAIASNTLAVTQTVAVNIVSYQKARNKLYLKHSIGLRRRVVLSVTNTLALSQDFAKHASGLNRFSLTQTIVQKFGINAALSMLSLVSAVKVVRVKIRAIAHDLNFRQVVRNQTIYSIAVSNTLNLTHSGDNLFWRVSQSLALTHSVSQQIVKSHSLNQVLNFQQQVVVNTVLLRTVNHVFGVRNGGTFSSPLNSTIAVVPGAVASIAKSYTVLQVSNSVIVLKSPNLSDTENLDGTISIKRSILGDLKTYVKTSLMFKLKYTWTLGRKKALELRAFLVDHLDSTITLTNWKGEIWTVKIINSPVEFFAKSRWVSGLERIDVTVEFEGVRTSG